MLMRPRVGASGGGGGGLFGLHRYWRVLSYSGGYYTYIHEIELRATPGGPDLTTPADAAARAFSSAFQSTSPPANAFDDNPNTLWRSNGGTAYTHLGWDFGEEVSISEFGVMAVSAPPATVSLEYSGNGTDWTLAWGPSAEQTNWQTGELRIFTAS